MNKLALAAIAAALIFAFAACGKSKESISGISIPKNESASDSTSESKPAAAAPLNAPKPQNDADYWKTEPPEQRDYSIYSYEHMRTLVHMDWQGNLKKANTITTEIETVLKYGDDKKPMLIRRARLVKNGVSGTKWQEALFDENGEMLYDYDDFFYSYAFGDLLIKRQYSPFVADIGSVPDNLESSLWNYKTARTVIADAADAYLINPEKEWYLLIGIKNALVCVTDKHANIIKSFNPSESLHFTGPFYDNGFIVQTGDYNFEDETKYYVLDKNLQCLNDKLYDSLSAPWNMSEDMPCYFSREGKEGVLDKYGNELPKTPYYSYNDGELTIDSEIYNQEISLRDKNGTVLAAGHTIVPIYEGKRAEIFALSANNRIWTVTRDGLVIKEVVIDNLNETEAMRGGIYCKLSDGTAAVLNKNLEYVILPGKYHEINEIRSFDSASMIVPIYAAKYKSSGVSRTDLYNCSFRLIADTLDNNFSFGYNRILAKRGFSYVLLDFGGSEIATASIFSELLID